MQKTRGFSMVPTGILLVFLLLIGVGVLAAETQGPPPDEAPLNPAFLEIAQGSELAPSGLAPSEFAPVEAFPAERGPAGRGLGHLPLVMDLSHLQRLPVQRTTKALAALAVLPAAWDWRSSPGYSALTPVKDQGSCGSCWAFGNLGAVEALYKIKTAGHPNQDLSENNMASCHWPWLYGRCQGGNTMLAASYLVNLVRPKPLVYQLAGAVPEPSDKYSPTTHTSTLCTDITRPAPLLRVHNFRWIAGDTASMKQAVYAYGPMVTAFYWTSAKYNTSTGIYYYPKCPYSSNHEVLIVGWNDNMAHPGGKGCWIVKNSWGATWGKAGYFYIPYGTGAVGSDNLSYVSFTPYKANENLYMEDRPGMVSAMGWGATTASGAIVFQAPHLQESLQAVEFFTSSNNAQYEIKVWGTVTQSGNNVSFAGLLRSQTGVCQEMGYYSIPLTAAIPLTGGKNYAITVKFTTPGYNYPLPIAYAYPGIIDKGWLGSGTALSYGQGNASVPFSRIVLGGGTGVAMCIRARTSY